MKELNLVKQALCIKLFLGAVVFLFSTFSLSQVDDVRPFLKKISKEQQVGLSEFNNEVSIVDKEKQADLSESSEFVESDAYQSQLYNPEEADIAERLLIENCGKGNAVDGAKYCLKTGTNVFLLFALVFTYYALQ